MERDGPGRGQQKGEAEGGWALWQGGGRKLSATAWRAAAGIRVRGSWEPGGWKRDSLAGGNRQPGAGSVCKNPHLHDIR